MFCYSYELELYLGVIYKIKDFKVIFKIFFIGSIIVIGL